MKTNRQTFVRVTTEYETPRWISKSAIKSIEPPQLRFSVKGGYPTVEMHDPRYAIVYSRGRQTEHGKVWFQDLQQVGIEVTAPIDILSAGWSYYLEHHARERGMT
jgi:hypothetical protein